MGFLLGLERPALEELAIKWQLTPAETSPAAIYREMTDLWSVSWQTHNLDARTRLVLDVVAAAKRQGATLAELGHALPLDHAELRARLDRLALLSLVVWREPDADPVFHVPDEVGACLEELSRLAKASDPSSAPLKSLLEGLSHEELQRLAERWGIADARTNLRRELLAELEQRLATRESARQASATLSSDARRALTALVRSSGKLEVGELSRRLGLDERHLRAATRELAELLFALPAYTGGARILFVPLGVGTVEEVPGEEQATNMAPFAGPGIPSPCYATLWDLLTMLAFVRRQKQRGGRLPLTAAQQRRLIPFLRRQDGGQSQRLGFLGALALGLGLVVDETVSRPTPRLREWQGLDFHVHALAAYRWWLGTERWRDGMSQGERDTGGPLALPSGRERLTNLLAELEPNRWYFLDDFLRRLRAAEPLMFRDRQTVLEAGGTAALERVSRYWNRWEGKVARGALVDAMNWLEIVALAEIDGRNAVALTDLGAWAIGRHGARPPAPPPARSLALGADGTVAVAWPDAPAVAGLLAFARQAPGEDPRYVVDRSTVVQALTEGTSVQEMLAVLDRGGLGGSALAANVRAWGAGVVRIRISQATILEAGTAAAMDDLLAGTRYAALRLRRVGPLHATVGDGEAVAKVLDRLRTDGFLIESSA